MLYDEKLASAVGEQIANVLTETRKKIDSGELPETLGAFVSKMRRKIWRTGGYVKFARSMLKTIPADQMGLSEPRALANILVQTYLDKLLARISGERDSDRATNGPRWTSSL